MTMPVLVADAVSAEWEERFFRGSAAVGEEAITSDIVLALEERFAPYVKSVYSFSRAEEGGGPKAHPTGADLEIHFVTSDHARHLGYRVQAKLAKRSRAKTAPMYDYDFNYRTGRGVRQIDALISAAGNSIPVYFLYNSPDAVCEIVSRFRHTRFYRRWALSFGCWPSHGVDLLTGLTIAVLPAQVARRESRRSQTHLVKSHAVADFLRPWSCLFHQHSPVPARPSGPAPARHSLSMTQLLDALRLQLEGAAWTATALEPDQLDLRNELHRMAERLNEESAIPDDVARLWRGDPNFDLDSLARARPLPVGGDWTMESWQDGDSQLRSLLIVEVAE
jgi:hypothetical protein